MKANGVAMTLAAVVSLLGGTACRPAEPRRVLDARMESLHFEDHVADATLEGPGVPADAFESIQWTFATDSTPWQPVHAAGPWNPAPAMHRSGMIDVLPTLLDLAGLPMPDVSQGQSLAPLLLGKAGWKARPVILDEFETDAATGELRGRLEVIDGRWGASMWIGPPRLAPQEPRPLPVLLYDLWSDPMALQPINEQHPELLRKYTSFLSQQWKDHQALATRFKAGARVALTPEQLERLRALGYIR